MSSVVSIIRMKGWKVTPPRRPFSPDNGHFFGHYPLSMHNYHPIWSYTAVCDRLKLAHVCILYMWVYMWNVWGPLHPTEGAPWIQFSSCHSHCVSYPPFCLCFVKKWGSRLMMGCFQCIRPNQWHSFRHISWLRSLFCEFRAWSLHCYTSRSNCRIDQTDFF